MTEAMITQTSMILEHLQTKGTITSMEAITLYSATRLSAIIFVLRKHHIITMEMCEGTNKFGKKTRYGKYTYVKPIEGI